AGRAAAAEGNLRLHHLGMERGADRWQRHHPHRAAARHRAALRPAAVRPPYSCGIEDNAVSLVGRSFLSLAAASQGFCVRPTGRLMKLRDLFSDETAIDRQAGTIDVSGLAMDSRVVKPGDVFFALAGSKTDG